MGRRAAALDRVELAPLVLDPVHLGLVTNTQRFNCIRRLRHVVDLHAFSPETLFDAADTWLVRLLRFYLGRHAKPRGLHIEARL